MLKRDEIDELSELLNSVKVTKENVRLINEVKEYIQQGNYSYALRILKKGLGIENNVQDQDLSNKETEVKKIYKKTKPEENKTEEDLKNKEENKTKIKKEIKENPETVDKDLSTNIYPKEIASTLLEEQYIGMLLNDLKGIAKYYILYDDCYFANAKLFEIYKMILFTDGEQYAPMIAKQKFNFAKVTFEINTLKAKMKKAYENRKLNMENIYVEIRKLFVLRKNYLGMPIKEIQNKLVDIVNYKLYDKMSIDEVEDAIVQVNATNKFKKSILNRNLTEFLMSNDNNLTTGLPMPFPILTKVFKGVRRGETMSFAMPSNAGKSRFTINFAATLAFVHKKKVLLISNEMTEDKMKLCLITTVLNNDRFINLHGQKLHKREDEFLEFKYRADDTKKTKSDNEGFAIREEGESLEDFAKRLTKVSTEYNQTMKVMEWLEKEIENSLYFVNITDHTNEELQKIIMNYYYKEEIEYVFYDTLKNDTEHIGNSDEVKKTATILANLAQIFSLFICSTMQLTEGTTLPLNLNINDLSASRTVKEVLDTLCLCKQIHNEFLDDYEYSLKEVDTKFYNLEKYDDPDVRYYACVVDKNRAGAKPKVLFRLNLAYNYWEELGYIRMKQK